MSMLRLLFAAGTFALLGAQVDANALCRGKPSLQLSDGAQTCILRKELTEITNTRSIIGGGPATVLKSSMNGAVISLALRSEPSARGISGRTVRARAKAVCAQFAPELLKQVSNPGNPFLAVEFIWGDQADRALTTRKDRYRSVYLTRQCWVRRGG